MPLERCVCIKNTPHSQHTRSILINMMKAHPKIASQHPRMGFYYNVQIADNFFFFTSRATFRSRQTPRIAEKRLTPTKLTQIPSRPKLHRAPSIITGKTRAVATEIEVARSGFSIALRKPCVVTTNHLNRYAKQNSLIA